MISEFPEPEALRPKKKGRKKTLDIKEFKKPSNPIEVKSVDTSAEHVKELEDELLKTQNRECIFKRIEETAFRGGNSSEKTARIVHSLRGQFNLKDILAVVGFPKATYMYWQKRFDRENPDKYLEDEITQNTQRTQRLRL